jgi:hypothetical protein
MNRLFAIFAGRHSLPFRLVAPVLAIGLALVFSGAASAASFTLRPDRSVYSSGAGPFDWAIEPSSSSPYLSAVGYKLSTESTWHRCITGSYLLELKDVPDGTYSIDIADDINLIYLGRLLGGLSSGSNTCGDSSRAPSSAISRDTIVIDSTPPVVAAPQVTTAGRTVQASVQASDTATGVASYRWSFGDGAIDTTVNPYDWHTYLGDGSYRGSVVVTDGAGNQATQTFSIDIPPGPPPPTTAPPPSAPSTPPLPWMTISTGRTYTYNTVSGVLPRVFHHRHGYKASCTQRSAVRVSCNVRFSSGPNDYWGTVTVYYLFGAGRTVQWDRTVQWSNQYTIYSINDRCYQSGHPARCRIRTRSGSW